jgi:CRISPR-associated protein Csm4
MLFGPADLEALLTALRHDNAKPLRLSSAFPYTATGLYYLPRPYNYPSVSPDEGSRSSVNKQVRFIPHGFFHKWLQHQITAEEAIQLNHELCHGPQDKGGAFQEILRPRLRLDRVESRSQLYHCGLVQFYDGAGLYCLVELEDNDLLWKLQAAFELLGESGLGGERSLGCGRFTPHIGPLPQAFDDLYRAQATAPERCLLSMYYPTRSELQRLGVSGTTDRFTAYMLVERGGFVDSAALQNPARRLPCRMFAEGSVFNRNLQLDGTLADVTPGGQFRYRVHAVYRYGLAFAI